MNTQTNKLKSVFKKLCCCATSSTAGVDKQQQQHGSVYFSSIPVFGSHNIICP